MHKEVDYDENPTRLYSAINNSDWNSASRACRLFPQEARTWVVRRERDEDGNLLYPDVDGVLWRFLPLHSALARSPPIQFIDVLINAYPAAVGERDVNGMFPLHYACGNRASKAVIQLILETCKNSYDGGVWEEDGNGMTPLHYLCSWGQFENGIVELLLFHSTDDNGGGARDLIMKEDNNGITPIELARRGGYDGWEEVLSALELSLKEYRDPQEMSFNQKLGLRVGTMPSPRSHTIQMSNIHITPSSTPRTGRGLMEVSTTLKPNHKLSKHLLSPRSSVSDSSHRYAHLIDSRSPMHTSTRNTSSLHNSHRDEPPLSRRCITTGSLESPHNLATRSTSVAHSNINSHLTSIESPVMNNMKTPRSSGRGISRSFGFEHGSSPSPRHHLTSPRQFSQQSSLISNLPSTTQNSNHSELLLRMEQLRLENEKILHRSSELEKEIQNKEVEMNKLQARLAQTEKECSHKETTQQRMDETVSKLQYLLQTVSKTQQALSQMVDLAAQRENSRLLSSSIRKEKILHLLSEEDSENGENQFMFHGQVLGVAFKNEVKCLDDVQGEISSLLKGLKQE